MDGRGLYGRVCSQPFWCGSTDGSDRMGAGRIREEFTYSIFFVQICMYILLRVFLWVGVPGSALNLLCLLRGNYDSSNVVHESILHDCIYLHLRNESMYSIIYVLYIIFGMCRFVGGSDVNRTNL